MQQKGLGPSLTPPHGLPLPISAPWSLGRLVLHPHCLVHLDYSLILPEAPVLAAASVSGHCPLTGLRFLAYVWEGEFRPECQLVAHVPSFPVCPLETGPLLWAGLLLSPQVASFMPPIIALFSGSFFFLCT